MAQMPTLAGSKTSPPTTRTGHHPQVERRRLAAHGPMAPTTNNELPDDSSGRAPLNPRAKMRLGRVLTNFK